MKDQIPIEKNQHSEEDPMDVFYLYWGILRTSIVSACPEMKNVLLGH